MLDDAPDSVATDGPSAANGAAAAGALDQRRVGHMPSLGRADAAKWERTLDHHGMVGRGAGHAVGSGYRGRRVPRPNDGRSQRLG